MEFLNQVPILSGSIFISLGVGLIVLAFLNQYDLDSIPMKLFFSGIMLIILGISYFI
jgi:hypothetical protein